MMKNQVDYFEKVIKILRELKKDHPDVDISKHYSLATDCGSFSFSDKELYQALQKHKGELDMNTLSDKDMEKVLDETDELFSEVEEDDLEDLGKEEEEYDDEF
jgi:hypothetical protein